MSSARVLVVDDTQLNLVLLSGILQDAGYEVRVANGAARALKALERQPADAVLLDIEMPETDGFTLCRQIKALPGLREVPVLFLSGHDEPTTRARAFAAGGVDYLVKPYEAAEVLARLGTQLELRSSRDLLGRTLSLVATRLAGRILGRWRVADPSGAGLGLPTAAGIGVDDGIAVRVHLLPPTREALRVLGEGATSLVAFRHPAVLPVLGAGVDDGLPWLVTPPYAVATREAEPVPDLHAVRAGLEAAHAHGLVHGHVDASHLVVADRHRVLGGLGLAPVLSPRRIHPADDLHALDLLAREAPAQA